MLLRCLLAGLALFAFSASVDAFQAVDELTPSSSGRFPAYPLEGLALSEFWVEAGAMVDDNILRRSVPPPTETVLRAGIGGRKDMYVYGRQLLRLQGRVDDYIYNHFSDLNTAAYSGSGEWHWALGNDLDGVLGASRRRYQRDLSQIQADVKDTITETTYTANGAYRLGPSFRIRAGTDLTHFSDALLAQNELKTLGAFAGLDYVTPLGNTFGIEYRQAHGDAPVSQVIDPLGLAVNNSFEERSVFLTTGYVNPFLHLTGRVGRTKRTYSEIQGRDFEGGTWNATADWLVTNKTVLGFDLYHEPRSLIDIAASHVVVTGVAFGPGWAPTAKLNFSARLLREKQDFSGTPFVPLGVTPLQLEVVRLFRLGAYWEYNRQIHWQFAVDHGERESNVLGRDYRYNAVMANVRYLFW